MRVAVYLSIELSIRTQRVCVVSTPSTKLLVARDVW